VNEPSALLVGLTIILIFFDLVITLVKSSFSYLNEHQLDRFEDQFEEQVEKTMAILDKPHLQPTFHVSLMVVHVILGALTFFFLDQFSVLTFWNTILATFLLSLILLVLEYIIEGFVFSDMEHWALRLTPIAGVLMTIFRPLTTILMSFLGSPSEVQSVIDPDFEDELKSWVKETRDDPETEGELEQDEKQMIYSIFQMSDTLCREIMVPRVGLFSLDIKMSLDNAAKAATESGHSRIPVYRGQVDNIVGLLYIKDVLKEMLESENGDLPALKDLLRPAYFVPETKKVLVLLQEMRAREVHLAIVVDEYGGTAGLVTLEDIVEEIVGEIRDEYDQEEEFPYEKLAEYDYVFQGRIDLDDFNDYMDTELPKDMADTLSGYIYRELGRVPAAGEELFVEEFDLSLTVVDVDGQRITKVRAYREPQVTESESEDNGKKDS